MKALHKDVYREIKHTFGRFMGILVIVALGVSFFSGLGATGIDMKLTSDEYFDAQGLMDIRVITNYGLTDNDIRAIREVPNVVAVYPSYNIDAMVDNGGPSYIAKVHSLEPVNRPVLASGRLPEKPGEALAEVGFLGLEIGDTFRLSSGTGTDIRNALSSNVFQVTGFAISPYYISKERGSGLIGDGSVDFYIYVTHGSFSQPFYSEAFVQLGGAKERMCFGDEYQGIVDEAIDGIKEIADGCAERRYKEMTDSAYANLAQARLKLKEKEAQSRQELAAGRRQMDEALANLDNSDYDMTQKQAAINESLRELDANEARIQSGLRDVNTAEIDLGRQETDLSQNERGVAEQRRDLDARLAELNVNLAAISMLDMRDPENQRMKAETDFAKDAVAAGLDELDAAYAEIEAGKKSVSEAQDGLLATKRGLESSLLSIAGARGVLVSAQNDLFSGSLDISSARSQLDVSRAELSQSDLRLSAEIAAARKDIDKAQEAMDDLDVPTWYVLDRDSNPGYASFSQDTDKVSAIGRVFPLVFFLVAALVSLTTMTRLVEERRMEIGALKSLGYSNWAIISKYVFYAAAPTIIGGGLGGYAGMKLFPWVIIQAYGMLYSLPAALTPISFLYWAAGVGMALFCTVMAAFSSCAKELKGTPASLMRPKAPKAAKKSLLERIGPFWKRLTFTQKVTLRNIIRYKRRFFMTIAGIGGCTALLLTAFGLRDSIGAIMGLQFKEIAVYDMMLLFSDNTKQRDVSRISDVLLSSGKTRGFIKYREKTMDALNPAQNLPQRQFGLIVPEEMDKFDRFVVFRDRATKEAVRPPDDNGVVITEKLSKLLGLKPGDQILLKDGDKASGTAVVSGVMENYFLHYVFMTPGLYNKLFGEAPEYNAMYVLLDDTGSSSLAKSIMDEKIVNMLTFTSSRVNSFNDVIANLDFIVLVLILSAGTLAFVVLINLSSINISERMRELATIEVLGFYDKEVSAYVFRESALLTILGALAGLGFGVGLHLYVLLSAETDTMMFGRDIQPMSYVYSLALTLFFSTAANMFSSRKLKQIQMVEALKSVE